MVGVTLNLGENPDQNGFTTAVMGAEVDRIKGFLKKRKYQMSIIKRLQKLTEDEKQILRYYVKENTRANSLRVENGVVAGLVADGIIYQSTIHGSIIDGVAHNVGDFVWDYLHVYPEVLNGSTTTCHTDKGRRFGY